ncbi:MAG: glycosyltransferase family 4 protein [Clostridium sp.]|uniref:glycosyltransferase family 4 protein n=1 Tax=Clostridium sp. TaxID=1506 RepID=UPI003F34DB8A
MKRILYVTTIDLTINTFLVPHIEALLGDRYRVDCACNIQDEIDNRLLKEKIVAHNIPFSRNPISLSNIKAIRKIKKIQELYKYDIVHVHTPVAAFITRFALRKRDIKILYTCHGFHFYKGAPLLNWLLYYPLEKISSKWTDEIITINKEDYERARSFKLRSNKEARIMSGVGIDPNEYVVLDFNRSKYRESIGVKDDDFMILILAEINKNKNHIQIIKALKEMKDISNVKVICAGKGPLENELKKKVHELGLENNIKFIGYRNDVKELLNCSDCVALFSKREGLGKCLLEGMFLEKVLVATDTRGAKTLIKDRENGFLVRIGDYKGTALVLDEISINKSLVNYVTRNSKKNVSKYLMGNVLKEVKEYHK